MILDWACPDCGMYGVAVALRPGDEALRVQISHRYARPPEHPKRLNLCAGAGLHWSERIVRQPRLRR